MEITIKISQKEHLAYIPKALHEILGDTPKATPNRAAVLMYRKGMKISDVLRSIDIIRQDLEHAKEMEATAT